MDGKEDAELVTLAQQGDLEAFGCLVERYQGLMKSFAIRMLEDKDLALEMVQEALLQAFLSIQNLNDAGRFKSWLYGIVINLCKNYQRKEYNSGINFEELSESVLYNGGLADFYSPEHFIEKQEAQNQFYSLIENLKPIYSQVIWLYYFRRFRLGEIVEKEGVSLETVKVRLHRARRMMRDQLRQLYPEMDQVINPEDRRKTMILVKVVDVIKLSREEGSIVLLQDETGGRVLPIWIGFFEGFSIAAGLQNLRMPRPMTYRWVASILDALEAELVEVRIEGLKEDTYLGTMVIRKVDQKIEVDARPSDLIALAVHKGVPVYAGEELMIKTGIDTSSVKGSLRPLEGVREMISDFTQVNKKLQESRMSDSDRLNKREQLISRVFGPQ